MVNYLFLLGYFFSLFRKTALLKWFCSKRGWSLEIAGDFLQTFCSNWPHLIRVV